LGFQKFKKIILPLELQPLELKVVDDTFEVGIDVADFEFEIVGTNTDSS